MRWTCANCFMAQKPPIQGSCWFCGAIFSNFEQFKIEEIENSEEYLRVSGQNAPRVEPKEVLPELCESRDYDDEADYADDE